jgi:DNA-binding NarL/FixJ family response regulator
MSKRWWRPARLVFLTIHEDADFARAALDAGWLGYVVKARLASSPCVEVNRDEVEASTCSKPASWSL